MNGAVNQNRAPTDTDSSGAAIAMMQSADLRNRDYLTLGRMLDAAQYRRVTIQRQVRAGLVIVREVAR